MTFDIFKSFDELEEAQDERVGGPSEAVSEFLLKLERKLVAMPATNPEALAWKKRRLARGIKNEWDEAPLRTLTSALERDLATMAA